MAGGLNDSRKRVDHHAVQTATLALHMLTVVETLKIPDISNEYIKIKIGLHTGKFHSCTIDALLLYKGA